MTPRRDPRIGVRRALTEGACKPLAPIRRLIGSRRGATPQLELRESLEVVWDRAAVGAGETRPHRAVPRCGKRDPTGQQPRRVA
jgi:hypothetical protein